MAVDSVGIIAILSMSYITTSVAKIPRVSVENQITILSVVKIAIKFSPCIYWEKPELLFPQPNIFHLFLFFQSFLNENTNFKYLASTSNYLEKKVFC